MQFNVESRARCFLLFSQSRVFLQHSYTQRSHLKKLIPTLRIALHLAQVALSELGVYCRLRAKARPQPHPSICVMHTNPCGFADPDERADEGFSVAYHAEARAGSIPYLDVTSWLSPAARRRVALSALRVAPKEHEP
jgi:hypothetical protein